MNILFTRGGRVKSLALGLLIVSSSVIAQELEPIIFTSKQDIPQSKLTSSVAVIETDQIENKVQLRATELLSNIPGIKVEQQGVVGGISNVYIRGAESKHTVIMIDGIKVFDPTSIGGRLDLSVLNSLDIEKVEVMKGPQSVLHGSDAIGGVINFITKKGSDKQSITVGSGITKQVSTNNTISTDNGLINVTAYYQEAKVDSDVVDTSEKDFKLNRGLTITSSHQYGKLDLESVFKLSNDFAEVDSADTNGFPIDSEIAYQKQTHLFVKEGISYKLDDLSKLVFELGLGRFERSNKSSFGVTNFDGTTVEAELRYQKKQNRGQYILGLSRTYKTYRDNSTPLQEMSLSEVFANKILERGEHTFEIGSRIAHNDDFGGHGLYSLGWKLDTSKKSSLRLSHKTAYKAPTVYELLGPETQYGPVGNADLSPEKSYSFESGYDYVHEETSFGTAIFYNEVSQFIGYDNSKGYVNIDGFITRGIEAYFHQKIDKANYGVNISKFDYSLSTGKKAEKKPYETIDVFYDYGISDLHSIGGNISYNGIRYEYVKKNTIKEELAAYEVIDLNYTFTEKNFKLLVSIKNILDKEYETSSDYSVQGRGAQVNLKYMY
jgi:vitamin B12 transporter